MTLTRRICKLFKADVHGLLDHLEEPEAVLKQAIRDMQSEIERGEQALADLIRLEAKQHAVVQRLDDQLTSLGEQLDVCFESENEDLARHVIRKKLETERRRHAAQRTAVDLGARKEEGQATLVEQKAHLQTIVEKMQAILETQTATNVDEPINVSEPSIFSVSDEDVEVAFLREQRERAGRGEG